MISMQQVPTTVTRFAHINDFSQLHRDIDYDKISGTQYMTKEFEMAAVRINIPKPEV